MNSLPPDPYKALGVSRDAQLPEIRSAHRKLVLKCHPDKVQDPALKAEKQDEFQKVQQAYELLSDEKERSKYDDQVKLLELRKEMQKNMGANTSAPRTPPRYYEVRTVDPRPDSFKSSPRQSQGKMPGMYSQQYPRSWEDDLHSTTRIFEEATRSARRTASYEKPSRRDDDREKDRERRKRKEAEEEAARQARAAEKLDREVRKAEKKRAEKEREKERERERKRDAEEKRTRHKVPYVEPYEDDEIPHVSMKSDKKKSSKKHDEKEKRERSVHREDTAADPTHDKMGSAIQEAASYMERARQKRNPALQRSQTYQEDGHLRYAVPPAAVPTPPSAVNSSPFPPPPPPPPAISVEEDVARRSSAKASTRRMSHDSPRTRDRSSHKKSSSGPKESPVPPTPPIIIDAASPPPRRQASFHDVPVVPSSPPRRDLPRANTMNEGNYSRPAPQPVSRAHTFSYGAEPPVDPRGRSRSRLHAQVVSEEDDSEDERRHRESRKHRDRRHKTHSPEPMAEYVMPPARHTRYTVNEGRTVPLPVSSAAYYREESPPPRRSSKSGASGGGYYPVHRAMEVRPSMPVRESGYTSNPGVYFPKVKESKPYTADDVQYSKIPHRNYREEAFGPQAQWA